jgi:hypothetical protein
MGEDRMSKKETSKTTNRRKFLGKVGGLSAAAIVTKAVSLPALAGLTATTAEASVADYQSSTRANDSFAYRKATAQDEKINVPQQADNGDAARYTDFSGLYSKGLLHNNLGIPNAAAVQSLIHALETGSQADFNNIIVGTPGGDGNSKLNGPQVSLAFDLEGLDSHATIIPASPTTRSAQTAAEQVEHY